MSTPKTGKNILRDIFSTSLYRISKDTGIPYPRVFRWDQGVEIMSIDILLRLAHYRKVSPGDFLEMYLARIKKKP